MKPSQTVAVETLFDSKMTDSQIVDALREYKLVKIGEGFHAHVFADESIVLKIFPPLHVGGPEDLEFIHKNTLLRYLNEQSSRWQGLRAVRWVRQKAKFLISLWRGNDNSEDKQRSSELCVHGYELCIRRGLMQGLPTRIIPNCVSRIALINIGPGLRPYLERPERIVMQQRFEDEALLINTLKSCALRNDLQACCDLIQKAMDYQVSLWRAGLVDTDMSFNIFENLIVLPGEVMQLHDANDITATLPAARWYVREKQRDLRELFLELDADGNPDIARLAKRSGIAETACKLYGTLPRACRTQLVRVFLEHAQELLSEEVLNAQWSKGDITAITRE